MTVLACPASHHTPITVMRGWEEWMGTLILLLYILPEAQPKRVLYEEFIWQADTGNNGQAPRVREGRACPHGGRRGQIPMGTRQEKASHAGLTYATGGVRRLLGTSTPLHFDPAPAAAEQPSPVLTRRRATTQMALAEGRRPGRGQRTHTVPTAPVRWAHADLPDARASYKRQAGGSRSGRSPPAGQAPLGHRGLLLGCGASPRGKTGKDTADGAAAVLSSYKDHGVRHGKRDRGVLGSGPRSTEAYSWHVQ